MHSAGSGFGGAADSGSSVLPARAHGDQRRALVVLRVDDLDAAHAELTSRGAEFARDPGPMGERMRVAYLPDPEGNLIELQEWLVLRE
jgi:predicted enzyme related to lactoylglutathione lyase